jgi:hypothetical protein
MAVEIDHPTATIYEFPMAEKANPLVATGLTGPTDERGALPVVTGGEAKEAGRSFLEVARRGLTEEELSGPAARRFLLYEVERLDQLCAKNESFVQKYHDQRVTIASLTEGARTSRWIEILSSICLAIGSAGLGATVSFLTAPGAANLSWGWIAFGLCLILTVAGVAPRVFK